MSMFGLALLCKPDPRATLHMHNTLLHGVYTDFTVTFAVAVAIAVIETTHTQMYNTLSLTWSLFLISLHRFV